MEVGVFAVQIHLYPDRVPIFIPCPVNYIRKDLQNIYEINDVVSKIGRNSNVLGKMTFSWCVWG